MTIAVVIGFPAKPSPAANEDLDATLPSYSGDTDLDLLIERAFTLGLRSAIGDDLAGYRKRLVAATERVARRMKS